MNNRNFIGGLYLFVVVVCVVVSTYSSFGGFRTTLKVLALPGALLIGVCLFASDLMIKEGIQRRQRLIGPLAFFSIALVFSTMSNFNYFYTNFMAPKSAETTYIDAWTKFENNMGKAKNVLANDPAYRNAKNLREYIDQELTNLKIQSADENNPGIGIKARQHMSNIQASLDVPVTNLALPNRGNAAAVSSYVTNYSDLVKTNLDAQLIATETRYRDTLSMIDLYLQDYKKQTNTINSNRWSFNAQDKLLLVKDISEKTRLVEGQVMNLVAEGTPPMDLDYTRQEEGQLGEIVYSLHQGFVRRPNFGVTVLSMMLSLFIDLMPLLFALLLLRPRGPDEGYSSADGARSAQPGLNIMN